VPCGKFGEWLWSSLIRDGWGNDYFGDCANGEYRLRSAGLDWVFFTEDDYAMTNSEATRLGTMQ
jgi:hypothetical protein